MVTDLYRAEQSHTDRNSDVHSDRERHRQQNGDMFGTKSWAMSHRRRRRDIDPDLLSDPYRRRMVVESNTRRWLQDVFQGIESSTLFRTMRQYARSGFGTTAEERIAARQRNRHRMGYGAIGRYRAPLTNAYGGYSGYSGYRGRTSPYYGTFSRHEQLVRGIVDKLIQFQRTITGHSTTGHYGDSDRRRQDRQIAASIADNIDRYIAQGQRAVRAGRRWDGYEDRHDVQTTLYSQGNVVHSGMANDQQEDQFGETHVLSLGERITHMLAAMFRIISFILFKLLGTR